VNAEGVLGVNQHFIAMHDGGCQLCCKWSRSKPGFNMPIHLFTR